MNSQPITANCSNSYEKRQHGCFGISPFNSYFSEDRLFQLIRWGRETFESIHLFVPDIPSSYTLEALGYEPEKAAWKARRQCQYLTNKMHRAAERAGYSGSAAGELIVNWARLTKNKTYLKYFGEVQELFLNEPSFQNSCLEASRWVLEKRVPDTQSLTKEILFSAARYFLTEIPLFANTNQILERESSVFCYHQTIPFLEKLYRNELPYKVSPGQGFVQIHPMDQVPAVEKEKVIATLL